MLSTFHALSYLILMANICNRILVPVLPMKKLGLRLGCLPRVAEPGLATKAQSRFQEKPPVCISGIEVPLPSSSCKEEPLWLEKGPVPTVLALHPALTVTGWPGPVLELSLAE